MKSNIYIISLACVAAIILFYQIPSAGFDQFYKTDWLVISALCVFLFIIKFYPMRIFNAAILLDFPILYFFMINYGVVLTSLILIFVFAISDILLKRPPRVYIFNISSYILSLVIAQYTISFFLGDPVLGMTDRIFHLLLFLSINVLINIILADILMYLRPSVFMLSQWVLRTKIQGIAIIINISYGSLYHFISEQQHAGDIYFSIFFFVPLVAAALISHGMVLISEERSKLSTLLTVSKKMNESIELKDVVEGMEQAITQVVRYTFGVIYIEKQGVFYPEKVFGYQVNETREFYLRLGSMMNEKVLKQKEAQIISRHYSQGTEVALKEKHFELTTLLAVPLILENEVIGVITLGKERPQSFYEEDKNILQTFANQASIAISNARLVEEKEKRTLVEERNRFAREIHDGIAQSIAAITIQIDSCIRKVDDKPDLVKVWLEESLVGLRESLKEIRQSIYSLRPRPTDTLGLHEAIRAKLDEFQKSTGIKYTFHQEGNSKSLPKKTEEMIYETVSEALQNIYKHAGAGKVQVKFIYHKENLEVLVRDDGIGFSLADVLTQKRNEPHFGLLNMKDSVERCEGIFQVNSKEEVGSEIQIFIPAFDRAEGGEA